MSLNKYQKQQIRHFLIKELRRGNDLYDIENIAPFTLSILGGPWNRTGVDEIHRHMRKIYDSVMTKIIIEFEQEIN